MWQKCLHLLNLGGGMWAAINSELDEPLNIYLQCFLSKK